MKDAPEVSWHVKFDSQNLKHSGDLARWSTIAAHRPSIAHESLIEPKHNLATLGIIIGCPQKVTLTGLLQNMQLLLGRQ